MVLGASAPSSEEEPSEESSNEESSSEESSSEGSADEDASEGAAPSEGEAGAAETNGQAPSLEDLAPLPEGFALGDYHEARQQLIDDGVDLAAIAGKAMPKKDDLARIYHHYLA